MDGSKQIECQSVMGGSFEVAPRSIYVWAVRLVASASVANRMERVLTLEEIVRADRFRSDRLRQSFVLSRGCLRILLARYLNLFPTNIRFTYNSKGKPALDGLDFNASHSDELAVFAFAKNVDIGVDVERVRALPDIENIARRFFCSEETEEIMSLCGDRRDRAFFLCWTRKEAFIKAIGEGLSAPLNGFRVTVLPEQPARLLHIAEDTNVAKKWTLSDLQLAPEYAAALAYRDAERTVVILPVTDPAELASIL